MDVILVVHLQESVAADSNDKSATPDLRNQEEEWARAHAEHQQWEKDLQMESKLEFRPRREYRELNEQRDRDRESDDNDARKVAYEVSVNDVIEISVVLVDPKLKEIVDSIHGQFHAYVKPERGRLLSKKCVVNTGIRQYCIDQAEKWKEVLNHMDRWLDNQKIKPVATVVYDDDAFFRLIKKQNDSSKIEQPKWARDHVFDLRKATKDKYPDAGSLENITLDKLLRLVKQPIEGKLTSSPDLAFNMALVAVSLMRQGHTFGGRSGSAVSQSKRD